MTHKALKVFLLFVMFFPFDFTFAQSDYQLNRFRFNTLIDTLEKRDFKNLEYLKENVSPAQVEFLPGIMSKFRPSENASDPYDHFLKKESVCSGYNFMQEKSKILSNAEDKFKNIPKEIFVSFLRVETNFGQHLGSYQSFGVYASLVIYGDSTKSHWATRQLEAIVKIDRIRKDLEMLNIKSSFAGAFGYPQFIPTSFLYYKANKDGRGRVDLYSFEDSIWSIGRFLKAHGWNFSPKEAVFKYNKSDDFVDFIFQYANKLKNSSHCS